MRQGVRLGVDVGSVRIGVSRCDPHGILATPVETVARGRGDVARIAELAMDYSAMEIVVGLPIALSGRDTASTADAREFAMRVLGAVDVTVRLVDERLSSVSAGAALRASGRSTKESRSLVDQVAAVIILQHAVDFERSAGRPPGDVVVLDSTE